MKKFLVMVAVMAFSAIGVADHHEGAAHEGEGHAHAEGMKKGKKMGHHKKMSKKMKKAKKEKMETPKSDAAAPGSDTSMGADSATEPTTPQ
jgi:hypothetical protein